MLLESELWLRGSASKGRIPQLSIQGHGEQEPSPGRLRANKTGALRQTSRTCESRIHPVMA